MVEAGMDVACPEPAPGGGTDGCGGKGSRRAGGTKDPYCCDTDRIGPESLGGAPGGGPEAGGAAIDDAAGGGGGVETTCCGFGLCARLGAVIGRSSKNFIGFPDGSFEACCCAIGCGLYAGVGTDDVGVAVGIEDVGRVAAEGTYNCVLATVSRF